VIAPNLNKKTYTPIAAVVLFIAVIGAAHFLRDHVYYPHVVVEAQENVKLEFLQHGLFRNEACQAAVTTIADAIRVTCPTCRVTLRQCPGRLEPAYEKLLSEEPIEMPSSRLPQGVVTYLSDDKALALAACRETERLTGSDRGSRATCYPPNMRRPLSGSSRPPRIEIWQAIAGLFVLLLTGFASTFTGYLIVRYEALHANWSHDPVEVGPQKFHASPTPRIGGLGVMAGLFVCGAALLAIEQGASGDQFGYLLFASLPAFLGGITEDVTKNVGVSIRLALTMLAAACGVWLLGAVIPRLDVPGIDTLLRWTPFAIAFTIFAVGGVANAINIIDGYNGLAAGHAVIVLAAMAFVSAQVGDSFLFTAALAMVGALLGFLVWNYPRGKIFLGDGGAYLLGFWMAEFSVLLVARHPEVSPWFPMLLLVYPIFETLFSIYRRKVIQGVSPGQPDRSHMHQVIYLRLMRARADVSDPASIIRLNNMVAPFSWLMTLCCAIPAMVLWKETRWLVTASTIFCLGYLLLYRQFSRSKAPVQAR
jgi:UDP-N-acetylmuramyl pentapeptide phosphotransferase/UDP-N-acetylglucosamine-1-phosphate transferase